MCCVSYPFCSYFLNNILAILSNLIFHVTFIILIEIIDDNPNAGKIKPTLAKTNEDVQELMKDDKSCCGICIEIIWVIKTHSQRVISYNLVISHMATLKTACWFSCGQPLHFSSCPSSVHRAPSTCLMLTLFLAPRVT